MPVITRVNTGEKTEYLFRTFVTGGPIEIETGKRGVDERDSKPYASLEGKGRTAILRLAESHEQLWQLFLRCRALAQFDSHGRFLGFADIDDTRDDDELETAWGELAELFEAVADFQGLEA